MNFKEWMMSEAKDFQKIAKKAGKFYGSKARGQAVAASAMWKALKDAGLDNEKNRSALAKAARDGYNIELDKIEDAVKYGKKKLAEKE